MIAASSAPDAVPGVARAAGDPVALTAEWLAAGRIGAIYHGRMEYGPRALGARSILASPADAGVNEALNKRLERTEFMPFAPVVSEGDAAELFDIGSVNRYAARFMTIACDVKPVWRERIPAVVHVDGSARRLSAAPTTRIISTSLRHSRCEPDCRRWSTPASMSTRSRSSTGPRNAAVRSRTAGSISSSPRRRFGRDDTAG